MQLAVPDNRLHGIGAILAAMLVLSAQDAFIKSISTAYPLHQIILVRACVALSLVSLVVRWEGGLGILRSSRPGLQALRGLLIVMANTMFFLGLAALPLAEAVAIFFIAPVFITALAAPILGERIGPYRWTAVIIGLLGVIIMMRPGTGAFRPEAFFPVGAALAYALMQMLTRRLGVVSKASALAFYIQLTFVIISTLIGLSLGDGRFAGSGHPSLEFLMRAWTRPDPADLALMILIGVLSAVGSYMMSQAYRKGEAAIIAPFEYLALPLSVMWGYLLWSELPNGTAWLGMALIVGAGLFLFYREVLRGRPLAVERPLPRNR
jgi:drug/metabolite transporter (DMT)-like permease